MQIDADEDMEHGGDFEDHCQCGCRELQVFQSDTYAGEHPMCIIGGNYRALHSLEYCMYTSPANPLVHIMRHNVISVITIECHRFTNIGITFFVVLTEMCDSHTCRSDR